MPRQLMILDSLPLCFWWQTGEVTPEAVQCEVSLSEPSGFVQWAGQGCVSWGLGVTAARAPSPGQSPQPQRGPDCRAGSSCPHSAPCPGFVCWELCSSSPRDGAELQASSPIVPLIVWALEEPSFLKSFFFSLFFLIFPPAPFSFHFQLAPGGQNRRGCSKTFSACFLSRDPSSWQKKQVPDRKKTLHHNKAALPSQLLDCLQGWGWRAEGGWDAEECRWEEGIWHDGDGCVIRGDRNNSAWLCLHCLLDTRWPLRKGEHSTFKLKWMGLGNGGKGKGNKT